MDPFLDPVCRLAGDLFEVGGLSAESSPKTVEAWDSVGHLNLVLALEQEFAVSFEPEEMDEMRTLGVIAALVGRKKSG